MESPPPPRLKHQLSSPCGATVERLQSSDPLRLPSDAHLECSPRHPKVEPGAPPLQVALLRSVSASFHCCLSFCLHTAASATSTCSDVACVLVFRGAKTFRLFNGLLLTPSMRNIRYNFHPLFHLSHEHRSATTLKDYFQRTNFDDHMAMRP